MNNGGANVHDENAPDSYVLRLSGKAEIPEPAEIGHNYAVKIGGSITSETKEDNQDGTFTHYFKFEPVMVELIKETGETIRGRDTRRRSQQLRSALWREWQATNADVSFEDYYDRRMLSFIKQVLGEEIKNG